MSRSLLWPSTNVASSCTRPSATDDRWLRGGSRSASTNTSAAALPTSSCIVAPKTGRHLTHATTERKARRFAAAMKRISDAYPDARRIHIIFDNLNTHRLKSLTDAYGATDGRRLWSRFVIHHTPKHGSWLNPAEIEVSLWSRECMGRDRIATLCELKYRTRLWNRDADRARRKINWRFTTADARRVFRYRPGTTPG